MFHQLQRLEKTQATAIGPAFPYFFYTNLYHFRNLKIVYIM